MTTVADNQVQLWLTPVEAACEPDLLKRYESFLDAGERVRWQRFLYPADRQRFLLARALVRTVLAKILEQPDPAALRFTHNEHGKPAVAASHGRLPLHFNLSHTDGLLVLAVSRHAELGVDVESIDRKVDLLALSARFFAGTEHAELVDLDGTQQRERFFALWTLKEAWVKARGLGLKIPLDAFSFTFAGKEPVIAFGPQLQLEEQPADWRFLQLHHAGQYRIALAVRGKLSATARLQVFEGQPLREFKTHAMPV